MPVPLQKLPSLNGTFQPFITLLHLVVQHREKPYFPALEPDELVRIINAAVPVKTTVIASVFPVL